MVPFSLALKLPHLFVPKCGRALFIVELWVLLRPCEPSPFWDFHIVGIPIIQLSDGVDAVSLNHFFFSSGKEGCRHPLPPGWQDWAKFRRHSSILIFRNSASFSSLACSSSVKSTLILGISNLLVKTNYLGYPGKSSSHIDSESRC